MRNVPRQTEYNNQMEIKLPDDGVGLHGSLLRYKHCEKLASVSLLSRPPTNLDIPSLPGDDF